MATHDGPLSRWAGMEKLPMIGPCALIVAMPTTAGTGSEVGRGALLCLADGRKLVFVSPHLLPKRALCDPALTVGLAEAMTAGTGMDALPTVSRPTSRRVSIRPPMRLRSMVRRGPGAGWLTR